MRSISSWLVHSFRWHVFRSLLKFASAPQRPRQLRFLQLLHHGFEGLVLKLLGEFQGACVFVFRMDRDDGMSIVNIYISTLNYYMISRYIQQFFDQFCRWSRFSPFLIHFVHQEIAVFQELALRDKDFFRHQKRRGQLLLPGMEGFFPRLIPS